MKCGLRPRSRRAVSDVVAVLLMVVIVVGIIGTFVAFAYSLVAGTLIAGPPAYATVLGEMTVPGSNNTLGILSLTVRNGGSTPITKIQAACPAPFAASCSDLTFSPSPLPIGATALNDTVVFASSGRYLQSGTDYVITIKVTFSSGSVTILPVNVLATS